MNLLLLPGNDPINRFWINEVGAAVKPLFNQIVIQSYKHWKTGHDLDLDYELQQAKNNIKGWKEYAIFAKSAGVVIATKGIHEKLLAPQYCLFVGTPIYFATRHAPNFLQWLREITCPVNFLQQTDDPAGSFKELVSLIAPLKKEHFRLFSIPGNNHHYQDIETIKKLLVL